MSKFGRVSNILYWFMEKSIAVISAMLFPWLYGVALNQEVFNYATIGTLFFFILRRGIYRADNPFFAAGKSGIMLFGSVFVSFIQIGDSLFQRFQSMDD